MLVLSRTVWAKNSLLITVVDEMFSFVKIAGKLYKPAIFTNENISSTTVINKEFFAQTVRDNTNIIDSDDNWNLLLYKEAYHIKRLTPFLNNGLKASRELRLFS